MYRKLKIEFRSKEDGSIGSSVETTIREEGVSDMILSMSLPNRKPFLYMDNENIQIRISDKKSGEVLYNDFKTV